MRFGEAAQTAIERERRGTEKERQKEDVIGCGQQ
jgi:hypothetical protein